MTTVVQPCARCGARWAMQGKPMHWCPRCRGVLLSPAPIDAPPERRNYRWVARRPGWRRPQIATAATAARPRPDTPSYQEIPRWGLHDPAPGPASATRGRLDRLSDRAVRLLVATTALFVLAAAAEFGRYLILLVNRTRLIPPGLLSASDVSVVATAVAALIGALVTAVAVAGRLVHLRREAYARNGLRDPRQLWMMLCGCLIPVLNLLWPGVYLTELAVQHTPGSSTPDPRILRAIRIWWGVWLLDAVMVVAALCWRGAQTLQAQANGVIFTVYTDLVAAVVAVSTLWVVRLFEGRDLRGRPRVPKRWLIAPGPAEPVIAPVRPARETLGAGAAGPHSASAEPIERASDPTVGNNDGVVANAPHDTAEPQHEEVMAQ